MQRLFTVPYVEYYTVNYGGINFTIEIEKTTDSICPEHPEIYQAWLQRENYGIKELMFGALIETTGWLEFLEMVDSSLGEYIDMYMDEYE